MIILVLALIWLIALAPVVLRRLSEHQVASSVARFRYRTRLLRRAYPQIVGAVRAVPGESSDLASGQLVRRLSRDDQRFSRARHQRQVARRRRALIVLAASFLGSLLIGAIPMFRALWDLTIITVVLGAIYVALLAHFAQVEAVASERRQKVIPMPVASAWTTREPYGGIAAVGGSRHDTTPHIVPRPVRPSFVLVDAPR